MNLEALASSPVGSLVTIRGVDARDGKDYEHKAFLPANLPASMSLLPETYKAVVEASAAVARLDQAAFLLPNPGLLARPAIRREAVSTSALEGTYAAFTDVLEAELLDERDQSAAVAEVRNYVVAAEAAYEWIKKYPISIGCLEQLQEVLVKGTRGDTADAGSVRSIQVCIGGGGRSIQDARFVPPPPGDQLRAGLEAWERWINTEDDYPLVVKMALGHYQFETLHPFNDGNGRLGRLVCVLQLAHRGELRVPVLNLSPWLERYRQDYQDHLLRCSVTGEFDAWISFFCEAVRTQASHAVERIEALLAWKNDAVLRLNEARVRGVAVTITEELIGYPLITPTLAAQRHVVSYPAANTAIGRLEKLGILRERTGKQYARMFEAPEVLRIIEL
jgi:Fic family protein